MSAQDNDKPTHTRRLIGEKTEAVDMKTTLRGNGKGGYLASTQFNGKTYDGEGWNESQAMAALRGKVNKAIEAGKFNTER